MRYVRRLSFPPVPAPQAPYPMRTETPTRADVAGDIAIRVVVVDDHVMFREGIKALLHTSGIDVSGEACDGADAVTVAQRLRPDVILLDLDMPVIGGRATLEQLQRSLPDTPVLIVTMHREEDRLLPLLQAGARGYLCKAAASAELVDAIRALAAGDVYVRRSAARMVAGAMVPQCAVRTPRGRFRALSKREQAILRLVAEGFSGVEVARQLGISTKTVDSYKQRIDDKLGLKHRTAYVRFAIAAGLFDP
jgi:DNA-binding NarL/FixJ family response regulator